MLLNLTRHYILGFANLESAAQQTMGVMFYLPLRTHVNNRTGRRTDEHDSLIGQRFRELCVLAQKSVTRMNCLYIHPLGTDNEGGWGAYSPGHRSDDKHRLPCPFGAAIFSVE